MKIEVGQGLVSIDYSDSAIVFLEVWLHVEDLTASNLCISNYFFTALAFDL